MPSMCNSIVGAKVQEGQTKAVEVTNSLENRWFYCRKYQCQQVTETIKPWSWPNFREKGSACCLLLP